jgi:hypothetical protein
MARPSPRTQGVDEEGKTFQKFGTQQLRFVAPPKLGTPYQGVVEKNFGDVDWFSKFYGGTKSTVFSERFQAGITGATPTALRHTALQRQSEKLEEMGLPEIKFPTMEDLFGAIDKHGCECEACKNGTGQCSERRAECNAWDVGCEVGGAITDVVTKPVGSWWEKYGIWVYVILGVIGLGILLWLLRPLFSMIGAFKGGSP